MRGRFSFAPRTPSFSLRGGSSISATKTLKHCANGTIMACDRDLERLETLKHNVARLGAGIIHPVGHDWTRDRLPKEIAFVAPFDRILVDAPCSNTGVMRRRVDVRWRLTQADFKRMQTRQLEIV